MAATIRRSRSKPKSSFSRLCKAVSSSPDVDSKTSEKAAWRTTSTFRGSEPMRPVERFAPRRASIGSTRVAIHAGAIPKKSPVNSEVTKANNSTGTDGDALMGISAMPFILGNAKCRIRRVPANATARPAAPPKSESKTLSVRA